MSEYIEREAALKLFDKVGCYLNPKCLERQKKQIEDLPTADVAEVRHGEWAGGMFDDVWTCKQCSYEHAMYVLGKLSASNYCPNCGAKMDGKGEGK